MLLSGGGDSSSISHIDSRAEAHERMYMNMSVDVGRDVLERLSTLEQRVESKVKDGLKEVCKVETARGCARKRERDVVGEREIEI